MPFTILRQDITKMDVDAIVNSTSAEPSVGGGADRMIHRVAGPDLLIERRRYGTLKVGQAVLTRGFGLPAKYVIHVLGPLYHDGRQGEHARLYDTYKQALKLAKTKQVQSIALPLIGSGTFAFPRGEALETALRAIKAFLDEYDMQVYLVVYDEASYQISLERFVSVESYLERHHEIPMVE
ncbi:MAG: RNase III inhibitor, partial [Acholeplasmatales bacterium]